MIEMLYLGHVIGENGVQVQQEKIRAIIKECDRTEELPRP
jgi:hypothetical protein